MTGCFHTPGYYLQFQQAAFFLFVYTCSLSSITTSMTVPLNQGMEISGTPVFFEYQISLKRTSLNKNSLKRTSLNKNSLKRTSLNKNSLKRTSLNKNSLMRTSLNKIFLKRTSLNK